jgi:hypothetical protein
MTVLEVLQELSRHPRRQIIEQWNWKSAVLSTGPRGMIFFATNLTFGFESAVRALVVDAVFRVPLAGVYSALTQAFKTAEPVWAATVAVMLLVPALAHAIEFAIHWIGGTPALWLSVLLSIAFSELSTLFSLFCMRRGVLVVGEDDAAPFGRDLMRLPGVIVDFLSVVPVTAGRIVRGCLRCEQD